MMRNLLLTALAFELAGCANTTQQVIFEDKCGANTLRVLRITETTFENRYERIGFQLNDGEPLVTDTQTGGRELPYDPALYAGHPLRIVDPTPLEPESPQRRIQFNTLLHFDPATYSRAEFDGFAECFTAHAAAVRAAIAKQPNLSIYFKVGAVAYGAEETFTQYFRKSANDYYRIYPDGAISHVKTEAGMETTSGGGVGNYVKLGRLQVTDPALATPERLATYVNDKGESLTSKFQLVPAR